MGTVCSYTMLQPGRPKLMSFSLFKTDMFPYHSQRLGNLTHFPDTTLFFSIFVPNVYICNIIFNVHAYYKIPCKMSANIWTSTERLDTAQEEAYKNSNSPMVEIPPPYPTNFIYIIFLSLSVQTPWT